MKIGAVVMLIVVLMIVMTAVGVLIATVKKKSPDNEHKMNHS